MKKKKDGRKTNRGISKPPGEKKVPITVYVKEKNKDTIRAEIVLLLEKLDF